MAAKLTTGQLGLIGTAQASGLTTSALGAITAVGTANLASLSNAALGVFTSAQGQRPGTNISTTQISALSTSGFSGVSTPR